MFGLSKAVHGPRNELWDEGTAVQKAGEHVRIMVGCRSRLIPAFTPQFHITDRDEVDIQEVMISSSSNEI
jgi:hypothetical protein